jgi:hypothetical protein
MAYAPIRSANEALHEGMTDGKYRKVIADRGGFPEAATYDSRSCLVDGWYGIHEDAVKVLPDGRLCRTPNTVSTPHADPESF